MAKPKFSVSEITTFHQTFDEDLASYAEAGVEGVGIWEFKLPEGEDAESLAKLKDSGLEGDDDDPGHALDLAGPVPRARRSRGAHGGAVRRDPPLRAVRARGRARPPGRTRARAAIRTRRGA